MIRKRVAPFIVSAVAALMLLSACAPEPEPIPSTPPPAFASEEEAFAAAEETYRAYTEAANNVDLANPETFAALETWTTGDFRNSDRQTFSTMHADGLTLIGKIKILSFIGNEFDQQKGRLDANVCVDVSQTDVVDKNGVSQVAADRPPTYALNVEFLSVETHMLISDAAPVEDSSCGSH